MSGPLVKQPEGKVPLPTLPPELVELIASFLFRPEYTDDGDVGRLLDWYYMCEANFVKTAVILSLFSLPREDIPKDKTPYLQWITPFVRHRTNLHRSPWGARPIRPLPLRIKDEMRLEVAKPLPESEKQRFRIDVVEELKLYDRSKRGNLSDKLFTKKFLKKAIGTIEAAWKAFRAKNRDKKIIVAVDLGSPQPPEIAADLCKEIALMLTASDVDPAHGPVYELHTRDCVVFGENPFFQTLYVHTPGCIAIDTNDELTALIVSNPTQCVSVVNGTYTAKFESVVVGKNVTFIEGPEGGSVTSPRRVLFEQSDEPVTLSGNAFAGRHLQSFESDRVVRWANPQQEAFADCVNIKTLRLRVENKLPKGTAFHPELEKVEIAGLSLISSELFRRSLRIPSLTSARFPDAVKIEAAAFGNKTMLRDVSMDKVVTIERAAFSGCASLAHVSIPKVKTIGESAFSRCSNLRRLYIPEVETIGEAAFYGCENLRVHLPRGFVGEILPATRVGPGTTTAHIVLKALAGKHGGKPIGKKKGTVFKGITFPINIGLGESYEDILKRWGDFGNYPNVTVVVDFPAHAFGVERDFKTLERLKNVLKANQYALACGNYTITGKAYFFGDMKFVRGLKIIINNPGCDLDVSVFGDPGIDVLVFKEDRFTPFRSTTIEDSVIEMTKHSFLSAVQVVFLPGDTPINLDRHAFAHSSASKIEARRRVTCDKANHSNKDSGAGADDPFVGDSSGLLFTDCVNLRTVSFVDIDNPSFRNCPQLEEVSLGGIGTISDSIFLMCPKLASISCKQAKSVQDEVFKGAVNLANVDLPSVTRVGSHAFDGCTALTRIVLPSAQHIEDFSFSGCTALRHVTIPATCHVEPRAFSLLPEPPVIERVL